MKIHTESADGSSFSIKFPNWLVLNKLGVGIISKSIVSSGRKWEKNGSEEEESKAERKLAVKKLKKALVPVIGELRAFLKRHPNFVLVEGVDSDGDSFIITL